MHHDHAAGAFVARWRGVGGSERANCQLFVTELCRLLGVDEPGPASDDTRDNAYVFERRVVFAHGDGSSSHGYIDCYRRGAFVLEAKKIRVGAHTRGFDDALLRARAQAEAYARALPAAEGRPPFVVVVDVGHVIELYAQAVIELDEAPAPAAPLPPAAQGAWPASLPEQIKAVAEVLASAPGALSLADIESRFRARGRWRERLPVIVDTLAALGRARAQGEGRWRAA
jgi:hypothetical protein